MLLKLLFNLSVLSLSLGQLTALFKSGGSNLYLFDIIVGAFSIYGIYYFLKIKKSFRLPSVSILFLSFTIIGLISLLRVVPEYQGVELLISGFYLIRWLFYLISGIVVYNMLFFNIVDRKYVVNVFIRSGVLISLLGFVQLIVLPDFTTLDSTLGWDSHKNRLASTFFDPNFVGGYLSLILVFLFDMYYKKEFKLIDLVALLIILLGVFLTFSRSAWLMLSVIIFIYGLFKSRLLLLTFIIVAFCAYFAVPRIQTRISGITDPADSAHFRLISWKNTLDIASDNLFLGVGFNTFRYAQKEYNMLDWDTYLEHGGSGSDSSLLFVLATTGIFGIIFYLSGFIYTFFRAKNLVIPSMVLGLLLESLFINSLFFPQIMFLWLVCFVSCYFFDT